MAAPGAEARDDADAVRRASLKVAGAIANVRPATDSRRGAAGVLSARALYRVLRPYSWRAQNVHESVLEAIRALGSAVERLHRQQEELTRRIDALAATMDGIDTRLSTRSAWVIPRIASGASAAAERAVVVAAPLSAHASPPAGCSRLNTRVGGMWVIDRDTVITPALRDRGTWEPEFGQVAGRYVRPGMTVVDVGANIGFATRTLAALLDTRGTLIAIEPEPLNFRVLCCNAADIAGDIDVHCVPAAASDENRELTLWLDDANLGDHRTWSSPGATTRGIRVPSVRIDDLIDDSLKVDFVKVDTQGSEQQVLEGMRRTLARWRPILYVEFWPFGIEGRGDDPAGVLRYYRSLGFTASVASAEKPITSDDAILEYTRAVPDGYIDLLLTPA